MWRTIKKTQQTQHDSVPYIEIIFQMHYMQGTRQPQVPFLWGKSIQILEFYAPSHSLAIFQKDTFICWTTSTIILTVPMQKKIITWIELKPMNQKWHYLKEFDVLLMHLVLCPLHSTPEDHSFLTRLSSRALSSLTNSPSCARILGTTKGFYSKYECGSFS